MRGGARQGGVHRARHAAADLVGQAAAPRGQAEHGGDELTGDLDDYRALLDEAFGQQVAVWTAEAEAAERFPRALIEHLGRTGVFAGKWGDGRNPDVAK